MSFMQTIDRLPGQAALEDELRRMVESGDEQRRATVQHRAGSRSGPGDDGVPLKQLLRWADDGGALPR